MTPHELNMGGGIGFGSGPISSEPNVMCRLPDTTFIPAVIGAQHALREFKRATSAVRACRVNQS